MNIQGYPEELNYVNAILHPEAPKVGSFLMSFCECCVRADFENYELLRPVLRILMKKYPCDIQRLAMEREDSGVIDGHFPEVGEDSIVPRPSAEADDALGVPQSWREAHPPK